MSATMTVELTQNEATVIRIALACFPLNQRIGDIGYREVDATVDALLKRLREASERAEGSAS